MVENTFKRNIQLLMVKTNVYTIFPLKNEIFRKIKIREYANDHELIYMS